MFVFPDQCLGRAEFGGRSGRILRQFGQRLKPELRLSVCACTWTWMRDSSREKKKKRNPSSRKIVGLKGWSTPPDLRAAARCRACAQAVTGHCVTTSGLGADRSRPGRSASRATSGRAHRLDHLGRFSRLTIALGVASGKTNDARCAHSNPRPHSRPRTRSALRAAKSSATCARTAERRACGRRGW